MRAGTEEGSMKSSTGRPITSSAESKPSCLTPVGLIYRTTPCWCTTIMSGLSSTRRRYRSTTSAKPSDARDWSDRSKTIPLVLPSAMRRARTSSSRDDSEPVTRWRRS